MATPTLSKHSMPGVLGPLLVDVRAGGRDSPRPAVVVVHGFKGFKDWGMFPPLAERLARAGLTAVSFNLSGSGVDDAGEFTLPEQFGHSTFSADLEDLQRVLDALSRGELGVRSPSSIGLIGHSRGGGTAVLQTERDSRVRALVTWAATSNVRRWSPEDQAEWRRAGVKQIHNARTGQNLPLYPDVLDDIGEHGTGRLDILGAAGRLGVPWLIVHGAQDESVSRGEGDALRAASLLGSTRMQLIEGPGAGHTFGAAHPWKGQTPELRRVFDVTLAWFATFLE
jgi:uncharacterized protein